MTIISVINDGKTIPNEIAQNIFIPQINKKKEGSGLGLTIVKRIIEAHGWKITLENTPLTKFQIFMPQN